MSADLRQRLRCPNGHSVARVVGSKSFKAPCVRCGQPMLPRPRGTGLMGPRLGPDGPRLPARVYVTMGALKFYGKAAREGGTSVSSAMAAVLEANARKERKR